MSARNPFAGDPSPRFDRERSGVRMRLTGDPARTRHRKLADGAEGIATDDQATVDALLAIYYLLDERLPATSVAPVESRR